MTKQEAADWYAALHDAWWLEESYLKRAAMEEFFTLWAGDLWLAWSVMRE